MKRQVSEENIHMTLRSLPARIPPPELGTALRVIASRERQRLIERRSLRQIFAAWLDRTRLTLQNMWRPLALPATGGVFSAVVLFSMWVVPTYPLRAKMPTDAPPNLSVLVETVRGSEGVGLTESVLVDVDVDDQGRFVDYQVISGQAVISNPTTRHRMENLLLFIKFAPATSFGMPTPGKARVLLLPKPWILTVPRSDWPGIYVKG